MSTINKISYQKINRTGLPINVDIRFPVGNNDRKVPLVLIAHGFKGYKDWGFFPYISEQISATGFITACFNFSLNGMNDSVDLIVDMDSFANLTVSSELADIEELIEAAVSGEMLTGETARIWNGEIVVLGHSLGGGVALLAAKNDMRAGRNIINKIILWSSVGHFDRYTERQKKIWKASGMAEFPNVSTGQIIRLNYSFIDDIEQNKVQFTLSEAVSNLMIPVLIVHGRQDMTVPMKEIQILIDAADQKYLTTEIIESTGHCFHIEHPFPDTSPGLDKAISATIRFLKT
ncbi:MAG: alpha/beta hydrolase [Candidatus Kapabacteria bacterium]|jgi:pimeloyl-ACP methyl ester carboxylesterase|nr:alpha/beta hydrolase [Candidatus Kapabacteria bacterium]